jgi:hypothetical protein
MLIFKGINAPVIVLKKDTFSVLESLHKYMTSKLNDKDHVFYYNYKGTNKDYWGEGYLLLDKIVNLPLSKRNNVEIIVYKENIPMGHSCILYYYNKKSYLFDLDRKYKNLHKIMDRLQEIFDIEDEDRFVTKQWKYLTYLMS